MKGKASLAGTVVLCSLAITIGKGQTPFKTNLKNGAFSSPEEIIQQAQSSQLEVRKRLSVSIGLNRALAQDVELCSDFDSAELKPIALTMSVESKLLIIKSDVCQTVFLVPVLHRGAEWEALPTISLSSHYAEPKVRFESLVESGVQEIIVSGLWVDWGTGIQQQNLTIFKLLDGKMRVIFDQPENLHNGASPSVYEEYQESAFKFVRKSDKGGMPVSIQERRVETKGKRSFVVFREFIWDPHLQEFRMLGSDHQD
jgi:hypothetical protein